MIVNHDPPLDVLFSQDDDDRWHHDIPVLSRFTDHGKAAGARCDTVIDFLNWGWILPDRDSIKDVHDGGLLLQGEEADCVGALLDGYSLNPGHSMHHRLAGFVTATRFGISTMLERSLLAGFWASDPQPAYNDKLTEEFWSKLEQGVRATRPREAAELDKHTTLQGDLGRSPSDATEDDYLRAVDERLWVQIKGSAGGGAVYCYSRGTLVNPETGKPIPSAADDHA